MESSGLSMSFDGSPSLRLAGDSSSPQRLFSNTVGLRRLPRITPQLQNRGSSSSLTHQLHAHGPALSSILVPRFILNSVTGLRDMANSYCQNQQDHQNHQPTGDDVDSPRPASRFPESRPCGLQYLVSSPSTRALLAYYPWLKCCIGTSSPMVLFDTFSYDTSKSTIKMGPAQFCRP
jgi:hypothetical protein